MLGVAATLGCRLVFGRDYFLIPAMVIIIAVLTVMRSRIEPQFDEAGGDEAKTAAGEPAAALPQKGGVGDE